MRTEIRYIELKTGYSDNGPAWIVRVAFSKSGRTLYCMDQAFQRISGASGNYYDIETGEEYWISGLKKTGSNRHRFGNGKIVLDQSLVEEYLALTKQKALNKNIIEVAEITSCYPVERLNEKRNPQS